jgi:capsular exopolysaccharide synthesis family protein
MSHVRNLLHNNARHEPAPQATPLALVSDAASSSSSAAPVDPPHRQFPVEEIRVRPENRIVYYSDPRSPAADRFRLLRMRMKEHWNTGKLKKVLVTGPLVHDGKSTIVLNLASALAERGKRSVLVVEADLHRSSIGENLQLKPWAGLTECLTDDAVSPLSAIRRLEPLGWYLLPAGEPRRNPTELLQTPTFGKIMQQLAPYFDWILVDSPPVLPLTDSLSLQQHADASLLVVRAGQTPREAIDQTVNLLGKKNILGIVLNGIERHNEPSYQQGYYNDDAMNP